MLFHITHVHTPETCPAKDPEKVRNTFGKMLGSAEEIGIKVVGAWIDGPAHTSFILVEADSAEKLFDFFEPTSNMARAEVKPVQDGLALLKRRYAE
jgi:hypothetical protein